MANGKWQVANAAAALLLVAASSMGLAGEQPIPKDIDEALQQLQRYQYDQPARPLRTLELFIGRAANDPQRKRQVAERLAALLADPKATLAAKRFICQQLPLVATETHVPLLAKMLDAAETAEMARRALEAVRGEASLQALRGALGKLKGKALVGAIHSLGVRRDAKAVGALTKLLDAREPDVAAAAAWALGRIATAEAAAALMQAKASDRQLAVLHDAQLCCAERLAAGGDPKTAGSIYQRIWESDRPVAWRLAALSGLVKARREAAAPVVLDALRSDDPRVQAAAMRLTRLLPGQQVTAALAQQLGKVDPAGKARVLEVLAERGDRSVAGTVAGLTDGPNEMVRVAAIRALARLGDADCVAALAVLAAREHGAVQQAARRSLARLAAPGVDERLLAAGAKADPTIRLELIRAIAARRTAGAVPLLLKAASDPGEPIRLAACHALAALAQPGDYSRLVQLLVAAPTQATARAAEKAALALGERLPDLAKRTGPVLAALKTAPAAAKRSLLRLLASYGGSDALRAVRQHLKSADATVRDAAVRALARWPDGAPAADLLTIARESDSAVQRTVALRGYLRMAREAKGGAAQLKMLGQVRQIATTPEAKRLLLAGLGDVADPGALHVAAPFLRDTQVHAEAAMAMLKVGKALVQTDRAAVRKAMNQLMEASKDQSVIRQAQALHAESLRPPAHVAQQQALRHDRKRSQARKNELAKKAPKGSHLVAYLNCGPDSRDGKKGGPTLRLVDGRAHFWAGSDRAAPVHFGSCFFEGRQVLFEATALSPKKAYLLGFSWWDYDHDTRVQSVWAAAKGQRRPTKLLGQTRLPSYGKRKQAPQEKTLPIPRELTAGGSVRIVFRNDGSPNVVVSEVWLMETDADAPPVKANNPRKRGSTRVLIVTGIDYPGHRWQLTAPALAEILEEDPRLAVDIVETPEALASPKLGDYRVAVLHFMPWKTQPPSEQAREGLRKFVAGGGGMVVVHFACGAFPDWAEFEKLAGRVYDPKLRAHDPHGKFRVEITDANHPITRGLSPFETIDEMYTCLAGRTPIQVLAKATSEVDRKDYPVAFVLSYGKGRVFHSPLGHDVRAFRVPQVGELLRRGCAWAAGLPPVRTKE